MKSICVYLGAKPGNLTLLPGVAEKLGQEIANRGWRLVYGGSSLGLMGILANSVINHGGHVIGIIPKILIEQERALPGLAELIITDTMQERKLLLQQYSDGFIVMPGGLGTLEEAFETWNAIKIGVIAKPIGFLNLDGYYNNLFTFIKNCESCGFISPLHRSIPTIKSDPQKLLDALFERRDTKQEVTF